MAPTVEPEPAIPPGVGHLADIRYPLDEPDIGRIALRRMPRRCFPGERDPPPRRPRTHPRARRRRQRRLPRVAGLPAERRGPRGDRPGTLRRRGDRARPAARPRRRADGRPDARDGRDRGDPAAEGRSARRRRRSPSAAWRSSARSATCSSPAPPATCSKDSDGDAIVHAVREAVSGGALLSPEVTPVVIEELTEALDRERRRARQLELAQEALLERAAHRQQLIGRVGHELRTPVTVILGIAQTMQRGQMPPAELDEALRDPRRARRGAGSTRPTVRGRDRGRADRVAERHRARRARWPNAIHASSSRCRGRPR